MNSLCVQLYFFLGWILSYLIRFFFIIIIGITLLVLTFSRISRNRFYGRERVLLVLTFPRIVFLLRWSFRPSYLQAYFKFARSPPQVSFFFFFLFFKWTIYLFIYFEKWHRKLPDNLFSYAYVTVLLRQQPSEYLKGQHWSMVSKWAV